MRLEVEGLSYSYDEQQLIEDIYLNVAKGEFVGIIGPNGSGKSTILKNLYRALKPDHGAVLLDKEDLYKMNTRATAKKIGVVGQENSVPFDFKVEEIVAMGRSPHKKLFDGDTAADQEIVKDALHQTGTEHIATKSYLQLSGGEKQRVMYGIDWEFGGEGLDVEELENVGITTYMNSALSLEEMYEEILDLGKIFEGEEKAEAFVADQKERIAAVQEKISDQDPVDVLVYDSGGDGVFTAGGTHLDRKSTRLNSSHV